MTLNQRPTIVQPALETPTHGPGGVFTITCSTTIHAPLTTILTTLLDTRTYPSWNAFCPSVSITHQPTPSPPLPACLAATPITDLPTTLRLGTDFTLDVHLDPHNSYKRSKTTLVVSVLEEFERDGRKGVRLAWRTTGWMPGMVLKAERVQELTEVGEGIVEYRCWETMYGALASTVKAFVGKSLEWGFGAWMDGLKEFSEKKTTEAPRQSEDEAMG
ncbi:hypothetical protein G7046_g6441 [Stylonectria norvegica]|nr:hypothetical protein G7046_g6441 [Stylonectria norvegica]